MNEQSETTVLIHILILSILPFDFIMTYVACNTNDRSERQDLITDKSVNLILKAEHFHSQILLLENQFQQTIGF